MRDSGSGASDEDVCKLAFRMSANHGGQAVGLLSFGSKGVDWPLCRSVWLEVRLEVMKHSSQRFAVPEVYLQHRLRKATKVA